MDSLARFRLDDHLECDGEEADAVSAYTQAKLGGPDTWITIPYEYWPAEWKKKYKWEDKPVVRLVLNLYGHPLAGLYWERHCQSALLKLGFQLVKGLSLIHI